MASIRAHRESNTLIIMKNSSYARPITHRINLIMGMNARCMEQVMIDGDLELGKNAQVTGSVRAKNVILGPGSMVYGDVVADGELRALDNAHVIGGVKVSGGAFIRPGVSFGSLEVNGMIEIQGKPPSKHIVGKLVVNDDMDYPEATKKMGAEAIRKAEPKKEHVIMPPKSPVKEKGKPAAKGQPAKKAAQKKGKKKMAGEEKPERKGFFGLFK